MRCAEGRVAVRTDRAPTSATLLRQIDACLGECGLEPGDLGGLIALRGPGSFTGLRVGLATVLGLRDALGLPTATLTHFEVMAAAVEPAGRRLLVAADALRGEWLVQTFAAGRPPRALDDARLARPRELIANSFDGVIAFGVEELATAAEWPPAISRYQPPPLAPIALELGAGGAGWDAPHLTQPVYARAPVYARSSVALPPR